MCWPIFSDGSVHEVCHLCVFACVQERATGDNETSFRSPVWSSLSTFTTTTQH